MAKDVLPPSYEAEEVNINPRYPRKGDTVFCASVRDMPIVGRVGKTEEDGMIYVVICPEVRLVINEKNVEVVFRPRRK